MTLTHAQVLMLRTAVEHPDGSMMSGGFHRTRHASSTASALRRRGLITYFTHRCGFDIDFITDAGRAALAAHQEAK